MEEKRTARRKLAEWRGQPIEALLGYHRLAAPKLGRYMETRLSVAAAASSISVGWKARHVTCQTACLQTTLARKANSGQGLRTGPMRWRRKPPWYRIVARRRWRGSHWCTCSCCRHEPAAKSAPRGCEDSADISVMAVWNVSTQDDDSDSPANANVPCQPAGHTRRIGWG